jgi:riboflavin synthase
MFTGIITQVARVKEIKNKPDLKRMGIELDWSGERTDPAKKQKVASGGINIGDSISINGVCLSLVRIKKPLAYFDVIRETLEKSNLSSLKAGDEVNVEFSLKAGQPISGHFVTGHVDCLGTVKAKRRENDSGYFQISYPKEFSRYLVPKASVALNGVSLTIAEDHRDYFSFFLIPHTLDKTNLKEAKIGDYLNIEFDILAKYLIKESYPKRPPSKISKDLLKEKGFI